MPQIAENAGGEGDIRQVVDGGEYAQLREFRDARDETELDDCLVGLQGLVELLHNLAHAVEPLVIVQHAEQWGVIFVDDDHHLCTRLLTGPPHDARENPAGSSLVGIYPPLVCERLHQPHQGFP